MTFKNLFSKLGIRKVDAVASMWDSYFCVVDGLGGWRSLKSSPIKQDWLIYRDREGDEALIPFPRSREQWFALLFGLGLLTFADGCWTMFVRDFGFYHPQERVTWKCV